MPIQIDNVTVQVVRREEVACDKIHLTGITINGSALDKGPPSALMRALPYAEVTDSTGTRNVYAAADETVTLKTADLYSCSARIPEVGVAINAVFAAALAWWNYQRARKAEWDVALAAQTAAEAALAVAKEAGDPAQVEAATADLAAKTATADTARLAHLDPANPPV